MRIRLLWGACAATWSHGDVQTWIALPLRALSGPRLPPWAISGSVTLPQQGFVAYVITKGRVDLCGIGCHPKQWWCLRVIGMFCDAMVSPEAMVTSSLCYFQGPCLGPWSHCNWVLCWCPRSVLMLEAHVTTKGNLPSKVTWIAGIWAATWSHIDVQIPCWPSPSLDHHERAGLSLTGHLAEESWSHSSLTCSTNSDMGRGKLIPPLGAWVWVSWSYPLIHVIWES